MPERGQIVGQQPPAVDFIDIRLPQYHDLFANNSTRYDRITGKYTVVRKMTDVGTTSGEDSVANSGVSTSSRPEPSAVGEMSFWETIFPAAMTMLNENHPNEPKGRSDSPFGIRKLTTWADVYSRLLAAQQIYNNPNGLMGSLKKGMRKTVDNSPWVHGAVGLVPDVDMTKAVTSVLKVLLDVSSMCRIMRILRIIQSVLYLTSNRPPKDPLTSVEL